MVRRSFASVSSFFGSTTRRLNATNLLTITADLSRQLSVFL